MRGEMMRKVRGTPACAWTRRLTWGADGAVKAGKVLSFSGDAEDDPAVDLFAQASKDAEEEEEEEEDAGEGEGEGDEPEDDFNAAWEVLDLARAIYEKRKEDEEIRLKLADTFIALGDVSLETGVWFPCSKSDAIPTSAPFLQRNLTRQSRTTAQALSSRPSCSRCPPANSPRRITS
jgi:hypothetical protein